MWAGRITGVFVTVVAVFGATAGSAAAQATSTPTPGMWRYSLSAGLDVSINSEFHTGATAGAINVDSRDYDDVFGTLYRVRFDVARAAADNGEFFGSLNYVTGSADRLQVGTVGADPLIADFDDYREYGVEVGYRYFFNPGSPWRPYAAGAVGVKYVDAINATFLVGDTPTFVDQSFYDDSFSPTIGMAVGVMLASSPWIAFGVETGLRYDFDLTDDDNNDIAGAGLDTINDTGSRFYLPLMLTGRVRF